jgi:CDP-diacylglycerol--glycerol-3-phosphate 3-phosphatidyltransferase
VSGVVIDLWVRPRVQGLLAPIGRFLVRMGAGPTGVTVGGFLIAAGGAATIGSGRAVAGGIVFLVGSAIDGLDGAVARASNRVTARGALLDATVDRLGEIAVLTGLAIAQRSEVRILLLTLLTLGGSLLIPYLRAKAEAEGLDGRAGLMGRAERVLLVTAGVVSGLVEPMLWLMVVSTWYTVAQRFWSSYRQL